jgi:TRAF3-interacting protein 1
MGDFWTATAEMGGQIFQKPKLLEKHLQKPPFRFLHDIFTATMEATGFGDGLFEGPELDSKSITEKDAKINFLTKLITLTEMMIGEELDVKPNKIVAGHEPEKTNQFLQAMFAAATSGVDSKPFVMQILGIAGDGEQDEGDAQAAEEEFEAEAKRQQEAMEAAEAAKQEKKKA